MIFNIHQNKENRRTLLIRGLKIYLTGGGTDRKLISELQVTKLLVRLQNIFKVTGYYKFQDTKLDM